MKRIINYFLSRQNRREYEKPLFSSWNERPVEYRFVFEALAETYPEKILDVGTGLTALPHLMANCGFKVAAIDNIRDYWHGGMFNRHYHVMDDDITDTKLKEKFNLITCISTLEHIEKSDQAVKNMFSLLNKKGRLLLTFPYNEKKGAKNVYDLPGSSARRNLKFKTKAYCRADLNHWLNENNGRIVKQEYWQFFGGEYWTLGEKIIPPIKVDPDDRHQISCVLIEKI